MSLFVLNIKYVILLKMAVYCRAALFVLGGENQFYLENRLFSAVWSLFALGSKNDSPLSICDWSLFVQRSLFVLGHIQYGPAKRVN